MSIESDAVAVLSRLPNGRANQETTITRALVGHWPSSVLGIRIVSNADRLQIIREHWGQYPVFWMAHGHDVLVSLSFSALAKCGYRLSTDWSSITLMTVGAQPLPGRTIVTEIHCLEPGTILQVDYSGSSSVTAIEQDLEEHEYAPTSDSRYHAQELMAALRSSGSEYNDGPMIAHISGGMDTALSLNSLGDRSRVRGVHWRSSGATGDVELLLAEECARLAGVPLQILNREERLSEVTAEQYKSTDTPWNHRSIDLFYATSQLASDVGAEFIITGMLGDVVAREKPSPNISGTLSAEADNHWLLTFKDAPWMVPGPRDDALLEVEEWRSEQVRRVESGSVGASGAEISSRLWHVGMRLGLSRASRLTSAQQHRDRPCLVSPWAHPAVLRTGARIPIGLETVKMFGFTYTKCVERHAIQSLGMGKLAARRARPLMGATPVSIVENSKGLIGSALSRKNSILDELGIIDSCIVEEVLRAPVATVMVAARIIAVYGVEMWLQGMRKHIGL